MGEVTKQSGLNELELSLHPVIPSSAHISLVYQGQRKTAERENVAVTQRVGASYVHSNMCMIIIFIVPAMSGIIGC